jgi:anti-sigma factor ChrR (cupin superfamily)
MTQTRLPIGAQPEIDAQVASSATHQHAAPTPYDLELFALADALKPVASSDLESLRARVLQNCQARPLHLVLADEGQFIQILPGVAVKKLRADATTETSIWRLDAGACLPEHGHQHDEECLILSGTIDYQGWTLHAGDYLGAMIGEKQSKISSPTGALLMIRGERRLN